jgi:hypothetical protein
MDLEEKLEKFPVTEFLRFKDNLDGFGMSTVVAVRRVRHIATRIAHAGRNHTRVPAQEILHPPEAAAGQYRFFS